MVLLWVISLLGSILAAFILIAGLAASNGAPQEAAIAAIAAATAIIPYVFARAIEGINQKPRRVEVINYQSTPQTTATTISSQQAAILQPQTTQSTTGRTGVSSGVSRDLKVYDPDDDQDDGLRRVPRL